MRPALGCLFCLLVFSVFSVRAFAAPFPLPPSAPDRAALSAAGVSVEELPGGFAVAMLPTNRTIDAADSRYGWRFGRAIFVYGPRADEPPGLWRTVTIHHEPGDALPALRIARLCARLLRLHRERFGRDALFGRGGRAADVWLTANTPPNPDAASWGGETRDDQVYVFGTRTERTPIEWVRTVAHEWGHLTLPAARGFTAPENDAAGFLGERLYLKWLRAEARGNAAKLPDDGTETAGLDTYYARQIAPLIARFQTTGPEGRAWEGRDAETMDLYIGAALATDDALGSELLGRGLFRVLGVRPRDLLQAIATAVTEVNTLPVRLPAWVPLRQAVYEIAAPGKNGGGVAIADRPPLTLPRRGAARLPVRLPGWKWMRAVGGNVPEITLRAPARSRSALQ